MDLSLINKIKSNDQSSNVVRLISQFEFALSYLKNINNQAFKKDLEKVINKFLSIYQTEGLISSSAREMLEDELIPYSKKIKEIKIHCVGHAHIDMNWMWGYDETVDITLKTVRTVLRLMDEYPDFTFSQSQASVYEIIEKHDSKILKEVIKRIHEGRWEVTASFWTESDKNLPSTESLLRHLIYTKDYLSKLLNIDPKTIDIGFEPDTFGHNMHLPEILHKAGVKYYYFCRGKEDMGMFNWHSPSEASVLTYHEPIWYNAAINPYDFAFYPEFLEKNNLTSGLKVYGVGDHGGGPTRNDIEKIKEINSWPLMPKLVFSKYHDFFIEASKTKHESYKGELNPIFTGCYTSQSLIKGLNKKAERELYTTEAISLFIEEDTINQEDMTFAWKNVLFNQFHDILTGSGKSTTKSYALGKYQETFGVINAFTEGILNDLSGKITIPECQKDFKLRYVIVNPLSFSRKNVIDIVLWDCDLDLENLEIINSKGMSLEYVVKDKHPVFYWSHHYQRISVKIDLEPMAYDIVGIKQKLQDQMPFINPNPNEQVMRLVKEKVLFVENDYIRADFNENGSLLSLINKINKINYLRDEDNYGLFRLVIEDATKGMTAWKIGNYLSIVELNKNVIIRDDLCIKNSLYQQVGFELMINQSKLEVVYSLKNNSRSLDIDVSLDWREIGDIKLGVPTLEFTLNHEINESLYSDQGYSLNLRKPQDLDFFANNFIVAESNGHSLMIVNQDNYGYRVNNRQISVKLLRSSIDPDKYPEVDEHHFRIGLIVTNTDTTKSYYQYAHDFLYSNLVIQQYKSDNTLPSSNSLFSLEDGEVIISSLRKVNGDIYMRLLKTNGHGEKIIINFPTAVKAYEVDIYGNILAELDSFDGRIALFMEAYQIKTIVVKTR